MILLRSVLDKAPDSTKYDKKNYNGHPNPAHAKITGVFVTSKVFVD